MTPTGPRMTLRTVTSSRPQLVQQHSESRQSVAASDDYFSLSEHASTDSKGSGSSPQTAQRYATPESHRSSPTNIPQASLEPGMMPHQQPGPMTGPSPARGRNVDPTTGRPDTPVRFAGHNATPISNPGSEPIARRAAPPSEVDVGGRGRGGPTPGVDDAPYIRFAIDQLTRDEEIAGQGRYGSVVGDDPPDERLVWDEGLGYFTHATVKAHEPAPSEREKEVLPPPTPPHRPVQGSVDPESFVAVDPPEDSLLYPPLDHVPVVLRPVSMGLCILSCLLMLAAIIFCNVWSQRHQGIWDYVGLGGSRYFVMQFLPQTLAVLITIWTFVLQAAVYRTMPCAIMASHNVKAGALQYLPVLSRNFVFPDLSHVRHGEPLVGSVLLVVWMSNLLAVPFSSCLFQAKYFLLNGQGVWRWASVQAVGWVLVAIYGLLAMALLLLTIRFMGSWTGLMWDPVSLADWLPIIQQSNILHDFHNSEILPDVADSITPRKLRLGYWRLSNHHQDGEVFYGMGERDAPIRNPSLHQTEKSREKQRGALSEVAFDPEQQQSALAEGSVAHQIYSPFARYRWTVWFLRDSFVIGWIVTAFVLFIAFVVVSFVHDAIQGGFPPRLPTLPTAGAFSSSDFLYSFVPALIGNILFLAWQPIDTYFRALQPFADLSCPSGSGAETSLLLSYPACLPLEITLLSFLNGHYKVCTISLIGLVSSAIPILAGGVFIALWYESDVQIRIAALMPAYYALVAFCAIYTISLLLLIWPRRRRYLPHDITTLADLVSFFYQSPLLSDKLLREPRSKADLVTRLVVAPPGEREKSSYAFGVYVGRDGREHLGVDRLRRPGRPDMMVLTG